MHNVILVRPQKTSLASMTSLYEFYGTEFDDIINIGDLRTQFAGDYSSYLVYGLEGNDQIFITFELPVFGIDLAFGGDGDDSFALIISSIEVDSPSLYGQKGYFVGGFGTDWLYIPSGTSLVSGFSVDENDFIAFQVRRGNGLETDVRVDPSTEYITFDGATYLTEDIYNGRIRAVDSDEVYFRTYLNEDWYLNGLDTFALYNDAMLGQKIEVNGTELDDEISTNDLQALYPGYNLGFDVNGLDGDDTLTSSFVGRNGVDNINGGGGSDFMSLFPAYSSPIPITSYAGFFGGTGTDTVFVASDRIATASPFIVNDVGLIEFEIISTQGDLTTVDVSPTVEAIILGGQTYLTEDIWNGRIRAVDFDEFYFRAYEENADWRSKGLDTYSMYHTPEPADQVNRLYNSAQGKHLFSSNQYEIDLLTGIGWVNEGVIYNAPSNSTADVFRFYIPAEGRHFYTALEGERDIIIGNQETFSGWVYEGPAFSAYSTNDFPDGAVAVVRYLNQETGSHVYSTSTYEQGILDQDSLWLNEGIAWYGDPMA